MAREESESRLNTSLLIIISRWILSHQDGAASCHIHDQQSLFRRQLKKMFEVGLIFRSLRRRIQSARKSHTDRLRCFLSSSSRELRFAANHAHMFVATPPRSRQKDLLWFLSVWDPVKRRQWRAQRRMMLLLPVFLCICSLWGSELCTQPRPLALLFCSFCTVCICERERVTIYNNKWCLGAAESLQGFFLLCFFYQFLQRSHRWSFPRSPAVFNL